MVCKPLHVNTQLTTALALSMSAAHDIDQFEPAPRRRAGYCYSRAGDEVLCKKRQHRVGRRKKIKDIIRGASLKSRRARSRIEEKRLRSWRNDH